MKKGMKRRDGRRTLGGSIGLLLVLAGIYLASSMQGGEQEENARGAERQIAGVEQQAAESGEQSPEEVSDASGTMEVHFIDVGQADATLIKCDDAAMLIDTGEASSGTAVQNYLEKQGVSRLDYLVLTHPDADHIGGAPVIIAEFEVDTVFLSDFEKDNQTYRKLIQALDDKRQEWSTPEVGSVWSLGNASFTILGPNDAYDEPNNASVALALRNGSNTFLFTGDAEEEAEQDILESGFSVKADVYKAGHHGSRTASGEAFMEAVSPEFAVISCGEDNSYGHPHAQTMNTLRMNGIKVFRTDEQGSVIAVSDGEEITWNCAPSDTWKAGEPTGSGTGQERR